MNKELRLLFAGLLFSLPSFAQPEGDVFPDFTVTDIEGNEHHLQSYLDEGKTVLIDVFATWCSVCINSLPAVESVYDSYGPDGDNSLVVFLFENDASTSNEATYASTYNISSPIIADGIEEIDSWNTQYQPNFFVICSDGSFDYYPGGVFSGNLILNEMVEACAANATGIDENEEDLSLSFYSNPVSTTLDFELNTGSFISYSIYDMSGKSILSGSTDSRRTSIELSELDNGIYFLQLSDNKNIITKKFIKQ